MDHDDQNEFLCDCCNVATHYCAVHEAYLCADELPDHPCPVKPIGVKGDPSKVGDLTTFNLNTQSISGAIDDIPEFFAALRKSVLSSLDSIEATLVAHRKESEKQNRPAVLGRRDPISHEIRVALTYMALIDSMTLDFSRHLRETESAVLTATDPKGTHANFATRIFAQAAKEVNQAASVTMDTVQLIDETSPLHMDYSVSKLDAPEVVVETNDFGASERVIETTEFRPIFKRMSLKPADDGDLGELRLEDFLLDDETQEVNKIEQIQERFNECRTRLSRVLDQALFDMNCPNFFERNYTDSVNDYMDQFRQTIEALLRELKNNFNKL